MRWVRSRKKLVSCIALFGLLLQLAFSFGHVHRKDILGDYRSSLGELSADIKRQIPNRDPQNERIFIRADSDVLYQEFMRVLAVLQDNEFYSVALVGEDKNTPQ